jgi:hypothetical protein
MLCEYCRYKNSWDCADGYNRRRNCSSFELAWCYLSEEQQEIVKRILSALENEERNNYWE